MSAKWTLAECCLCVLILVQALSTSAAETETTVIRVGGSNSLVESAEVWGKDYSKEHPNVTIVAVGGGTAVGFRKLFDKEVDMAFAAEQISDEEKLAASKKGVTPVEHFVANGGICVVCNEANPVESLTRDQIRKLFTGGAKSWKEVGGPDIPVKVILRPADRSGTNAAFAQRMLDGAKFADDVITVTTYRRLLNHVTDERGAIGVVGCLVLTTKAHSTKVIALKTKEDAPPVKWSKKAFDDGTYPISGPLHFYWDGKSPNTAYFKAFAEYCAGRIWDGK